MQIFVQISNAQASNVASSQLLHATHSQQITASYACLASQPNLARARDTSNIEREPPTTLIHPPSLSEAALPTGSRIH